MSRVKRGVNDNGSIVDYNFVLYGMIIFPSCFRISIPVVGRHICMEIVKFVSEVLEKSYSMEPSHTRSDG